MKESTSRVAEWLGFPFDLDDALAAAGQEVAAQLRLDLPADFAVSLAKPRDEEDEQDYSPQFQTDPDGGVYYEEPPQPSAVNGVVSVAVVAPGGLVEAFEKAGKLVRAEENGEYIIEVERDLHCLLGPSLGESSHRLACGLSHEDIEALGGFANTTLATFPFAEKALYAEVRFDALRARYGSDVRQLRSALPTLLKEASIGSERFDRALEQASHALVEEFIAWAEDVDTWSFALDVERERDLLLAESTLRFASNRSYLAGAIQRSAAENGSVPALFWDLPRDVDAASFSARHSVHESEKRIADTVAELLAGALEHAGVASGVLDTWVKSFRSLIESPGTVVFATGNTPPATRPKGKNAGLLDGLGYYLVGVEGDGEAYARAWRSSVATFNDRRLRAELSKALGEDLPKVPLLRSRPVRRTKGLPPIELYEITFPLAKSELGAELKANKLSVYLSLTTLGQRTWFGVGLSEHDATHPVRQLTSGEGYAKLGAREGLDSLHRDAMYQGSFATLRSYSNWLGAIPFAPQARPMGALLNNAMPHGGTTPAVFQLKTVAAPRPTVTATLEIPKEAFEDGTALFVALAAAYASSFSELALESED